MSGNRRAERRRQRRERERRDRYGAIEPDADYLVQVGWCDGSDEALAETKQYTHDRVVEGLGLARTGPVTWKIIDDKLAAYATLDQMMEGASEPHRDMYRRVRAHVREWGGTVVLAMAPGTDDGSIGLGSPDAS